MTGPDVRVTGGYESNDPVMMSREEYRAALAQARREGVEAFRDMAIQDWSAGKVYSRQTVNAWLRGLTARLLAKEEL